MCVGGREGERVVRGREEQSTVHNEMTVNVNETVEKLKTVIKQKETIYILRLGLQSSNTMKTMLVHKNGVIKIRMTSFAFCWCTM